MKSDKPNIVMVSFDSVRADHTPFGGYNRDTCPFLEELAEDALVFENTQVSAVGTPASFHGVFSGDHTSGSMENPNPEHWRETLDGDRLLPEVLQNEGYHTGAFHYNALMSSAFGWDRGWDVYEDHMWDEKGGQSPTNDDVNDLKSQLYEFLQQRGLGNLAMHIKKMVFADRPSNWEMMWDNIESFLEDSPEPWFLWVLLIDTHHPYYSPPESQEWTQPGIRATYAYNYVMRRHRRLVGERNQSIINAYDNTIRHADRFLNRLWQTLDGMGYGDVPFVFHSDHGDEMGEHGNYGHRPLMYDTVTRVPLIIGNIDDSGVREGPHSLLGLGNAILDIAGIDERLGNGYSLLTDQKDYVTIQNLLTDELGRTAATVDSEWKVLFHPDGEWGHGMDFEDGLWEAYHLPSDRLEKNDRWGDHPTYLEDKLRNQLENGEKTGDRSGAVDKQTQDRLRELGYLE